MTRMKRVVVSCLLLAVFTTGLYIKAAPAQGDPSLESFWSRFKTAVSAGDRNTVAQLSQFPLAMPYGVPKVNSRAQLVRRYRQIFNANNAAKCFAESQPVIDVNNHKRFTVGCKNAAGDEVIVYAFVLTKAGWKFKSLDNLNE